MSQDCPHLPELLRTVRELLDGLGPKVAESARYELRVASFLLSVAERELALGPSVAEKERAELEALLGGAADSDSLEALAAVLSARLRKGELDDRLDDVLAVVLRLVTDKVRIVRPSHLDEEHRAG